MTQDRKIKLKAQGLNLSFAENHVLKDVDLELPANTNAVLIGPAASGKSVLLKCLVGLYPPDRGTIEIDGLDLTALKGRARNELIEGFGMLFQQGGLFDGLPVWENIAFKLINRHKMGREEAKQIAIEKLTMVKLSPDVADLFPVELSGGMQKRVGIARAIADQPNLLLLDEPTAGLDPITTNRIDAMIRRAVDELGATALSITSDMDAARRHYDYLYMIHEGRILWAGPTDEVAQADNPYLHQMINGQADGPIKMRVHARV